MIIQLLYIVIINLITFGGGPVYIPIYEQFYTHFNIASQDDYYVIVAIQNAFPGVTGGKLGGYAMYLEYGLLGFILSTLAFVIPGIILMLIAMKSFEKLRNSKYFNSVNEVTKPIIIAILVKIGIDFFIKAFHAINIYYFIFYVILVAVLLKIKVKVYRVIYITLIVSIILYLFPIV